MKNFDWVETIGIVFFILAALCLVGAIISDVEHTKRGCVSYYTGEVHCSKGCYHVTAWSCPDGKP